MTTIELLWTWKLTSAAHLGSGLSNPSVADRLITRDAFGKPMVTGDAVKGALRMAAEQLSNWLHPLAPGAAVPLAGSQRSRCDRYASTTTAEPASWPMAYAFGADGHCHVTPPKIGPTGLEAPREPPTIAVSSTAIDGGTGTALDDTLRSTELLASGATLTNASWSVCVPDDDRTRQVVETLLVAALCACESIGAHATSGAGALQILTLSGLDAAQALQPARLAALKEALAEPRRGTTLPSVAGGSRAAASHWYRLHVVLREPCCIGRGPEISNHVRTRTELPATALRGAIAASWRRAGSATEQQIADRLSETTCWSPGFVAVNEIALVPAPRSFLRARRGSSADTVVDVFAGSDGTGVKRAPMDDTWVSMAGGAIQCLSPITLSQMHVARDYITGSKVDGALFSREVLIPDRTEFVAFVRSTPDCFMPEGVEKHRLKVRLGKRTSAGNGSADVAVRRMVEGEPSFASLGHDRNDSGGLLLVVHALSPLMVFDPKTGWPLPVLSAEDWCRLLGVDAGTLQAPNDQLPRVMAAVAPSGGWMTHWGHGRAPMPTLVPGSVWRLAAKDNTTARAVLATPLCQVGDRTHEGFGWVAVSTARTDAAVSATTMGQAGEGPKRVSWPGIDAVPDTVVDSLIENLPRTVDREAAGPLHHLLAHARTAKTSDDIIELRGECHHWSTRKSPGQWRFLADGEPVGRFLERTWGRPDAEGSYDPATVRFALELLAIRAASPNRGATGEPS